MTLVSQSPCSCKSTGSIQKVTGKWFVQVLVWLLQQSLVRVPGQVLAVNGSASRAQPGCAACDLAADSLAAT
jgi:hypothetical protein